MSLGGEETSSSTEVRNSVIKLKDKAVGLASSFVAHFCDLSFLSMLEASERDILIDYVAIDYIRKSEGPHVNIARDEEEKPFISKVPLVGNLVMNGINQQLEDNKIAISQLRQNIEGLVQKSKQPIKTEVLQRLANSTTAIRFQEELPMEEREKRIKAYIKEQEKAVLRELGKEIPEY